MLFTNKRDVLEILDKKRRQSNEILEGATRGKDAENCGNCRPVFVSAVLLAKDLRSRPLSCCSRDIVALNFGIV